MCVVGGGGREIPPLPGGIAPNSGEITGGGGVEGSLPMGERSCVEEEE